ncbi:hypothetical protein [Parabacteroides sp. PF5-9]|uniref:hypothetical protein n=1 Tax=Parabacteroides sp. PF5-9 TaxID=1742404 RepID=UPI002476A254|nr:hypothetical protein [Parabacteroides sp. PF5-9]MDH6358028.1 hypothetical protein [Parabacteroides sp. PF5-9]
MEKKKETEKLEIIEKYQHRTPELHPEEIPGWMKNDWGSDTIQDMWNNLQLAVIAPRKI